MPERHTARGWWLEEAGEPNPAPALQGDRTADVAIAGGGYTGLWAAWHLKRIAPEARVVLCEARTCGDGPSGRNGGFCNALWFSLPAMRRRFGDRAARELALAAQESVDEVGRFCEEQQVDAWFRRGGYMQASTAPAWDDAWDETVASCRELGLEAAVRPLAPAEVRARCDSPRFRAGVFYPGGATVQPARLALGLRARAIEAGVELFERSPARLVRRDGSAALRCDGGEVRAGAIVIATGGRVAALPGMGRRLTLTSSHMAITEPVPDLLERLGWTGGESITDSRATINYFRTTPDGRIAFGWGGGRIARGARTGGRAELDPAIVAEVERHLLSFFPALRGRRIVHGWGGPVDASPSHLPVIEQLAAGVHCVFGYTGHGVGPSQMVGRALASLALDRRDDPTRLAIVSPPPVRVPPEPFRVAGGAIIRRALLRKERLLERGRRPDPVTRAVAGIPERIGFHIGRG